MNYKIIQQDPAMKSYFDSLPAFAKENLLYSGVEAASLDEMKQCCEKLIAKNG